MYNEDTWAAKQTLRGAIGQFAAHGDARAMEPVFFALSRLEGDDGSLLRRYALAGELLHPYYFIRENANDLYAGVPPKHLLKDVDRIRKAPSWVRRTRSGEPRRSRPLPSHVPPS